MNGEKDEIKGLLQDLRVIKFAALAAVILLAINGCEMKTLLMGILKAVGGTP